VRFLASLSPTPRATSYGRSWAYWKANRFIFMLHGQWVEPAGNVELPCSSGRDVIKDICKDAGVPFAPDKEASSS